MLSKVQHIQKHDIARFCDKTSFVSLCGVVLCIPFSIAGVEIFFTVALISSIVKRTAVQDISSPINKPALILMGLFLISVFISFLRSEYTYLAFRGYIRWAKYCLMVLIVADTIREKERLFMFLNIFLVVLGIASLDGIVQLYVGKDFLRWQEPVISYYGIMIRAGFGHYNNYSAFLTALIPLCLSVAFSKDDQEFFWPKSLSKVILVLATYAFWFTKSRSGMMGLAFALLVLGVCFRRRRYIFFLFYFCLAVIIYWLVAEQVPWIGNVGRGQAVVGIMDNGKSGQIIAQDYSQNSIIKNDIALLFRGTGGRFEMWKEAFGLIKNRPIFGYGPNTYLRHLKTYITYAHNSYIQMAVELGISGLVLFVGMIGYFLFCFFRKEQFTSDNINSNILIGLIGSLLAFLAHSMFDHDLYVLVLSALSSLLIGTAIATSNICRAQVAEPLCKPGKEM